MEKLNYMGAVKKISKSANGECCKWFSGNNRNLRKLLSHCLKNDIEIQRYSMDETGENSRTAVAFEYNDKNREMVGNLIERFYDQEGCKLAFSKGRKVKPSFEISVDNKQIKEMLECIKYGERNKNLPKQMDKAMEIMEILYDDNKDFIYIGYNRNDEGTYEIATNRNEKGINEFVVNHVIADEKKTLEILKNFENRRDIAQAEEKGDFNTGKPLNIREVPRHIALRMIQDFSEGNEYLLKLLLCCYDKGIDTKASCIGDEASKGIPYVMFDATDNNLEAINKMMQHFLGVKDVEMRFYAEEGAKDFTIYDTSKENGNKLFENAAECITGPNIDKLPQVNVIKDIMGKIADGDGDSGIDFEALYLNGNTDIEIKGRKYRFETGEEMGFLTAENKSLDQRAENGKNGFALDEVEKGTQGVRMGKYKKILERIGNFVRIGNHENDKGHESIK